MLTIRWASRAYDKLNRQPVECHLKNGQKSRYQLIYQLSEKAGSEV